MEHDSTDLSAFYASPLGLVARRLILRRLRTLWPDVKGTRLLGYGFAIPFLRAFMEEADHIAALVPSNLGTIAWPPNPVLSLLANEDALPFPDAMFDRVLVVHGLESAETTRALMRQLWRILASDAASQIPPPSRARPQLGTHWP